MAKLFDLVVIGTGAAAAGVASRCKSAGWKVAIVDNLPYGGTCQLRDCDPKKVLVGAAPEGKRDRGWKRTNRLADPDAIQAKYCRPRSRKR